MVWLSTGGGSTRARAVRRARIIVEARPLTVVYYVRQRIKAPISVDFAMMFPSWIFSPQRFTRQSPVFRRTR
jgi:hypothetical protein